MKNEVQSVDSKANDFFTLDNCKHVMALCSANLGHATNSLEDQLRDLEECMKSKIRDNVEALLSDDSAEHYSQLARCIVKSFAVGIELSFPTTDEYIKTQLELLDERTKFQVGVELRDMREDTAIEDLVTQLLDTFPEFVQFSREFLAGKVSCRIEQILPQLRGHLSAKDCDMIQTAFEAFEEDARPVLNDIVAKKFRELDSFVMRTALIDALKSATPGSVDYAKAAGKIVAYVSTIWSYLSMRNTTDKREQLLTPHDAQLVAIFLLLGVQKSSKQPSHLNLQNTLLQVGTGEGKSVILALTAVVLALCGYEVYIVCYSNYLSARDAEDFRGLFVKLSVARRIHYDTCNGLVDTFMEMGLLPDYRDALDCLMREVPFQEKSSQQQPNRVLLMDEVDVFFSQDFYSSCRHTGHAIRSPDVVELYQTIYERRGRPPKLEDILTWGCTKRLLAQYPRLVDVLKNKVDRIARDLLKFPAGKPMTHKCVISSNESRIGYVNRATEEVSFSRISHSVSFACIEAATTGQFKNPDRAIEAQVCLPLTSGEMPYSMVTQHCDLIMGVSGTLSTLSKEQTHMLSQNGLGAPILIPSMFEKKQRMHTGTRVFGGDWEKECFKALCRSLVSELEEGRAVLVVFDTAVELNRFANRLRMDPIRQSSFRAPAKLVGSLTTRERTAIVSRAIRCNSITLMIRHFGRGTDFVCYDSALVNAGGVHVILTFFPRTKSEEVQIFGRTGRQNDPGSVEFILWEPELRWARATIKGRESFGQRPQHRRNSTADRESFASGKPNRHRYNRVSTDSRAEDSDAEPIGWYDYLSKCRDAVQVGDYKAMKAALKENQETYDKNNKWVQLCKEGKFDEAFALVQEFV
eukprot:c11776_g2_i1.p1 GENE.c11776_g2_i1~~c11776_g2_i1.p1  ORF type:complete len:863 (+),score=161.43 c11776_g2_i1:2087-4675(+)